MIVECTSEGDACLAEPLDFRNFKLVLKGGCGTRPAAIEGITFVDDDNALVAIDLVSALPGRPDDAAWKAAYADMIERARKHGWIDAKVNAIRAHVERER
jgi:hypothetical protein